MLRKLYAYQETVNNPPNRSYSTKPTYYDILNVRQNCTIKEIRNSFLKLSKKCHPDVKGANNDSNSKEQYLKIMEAYQVLSKVDSRRSYDLSLEENMARRTVNTYSPGQQNWRVKPDINPNPEPYYGFKGLNKVSNTKIVGILLFIAVVGTAFEFYLVRNSMTFRRDLLDEKSREAGEQHANVRADAEKYGNEKQLKRLTEKILNRNNGT